eukprot:Em0022g287a
MSASEPTNPRPPAMPPRPLPPGWKMSQCEKGVYYWHKETKRTQWHFPEEEVPSAKTQEKRHSYVNIVEQGTSLSPQTNSPATPVDQSQGDNTYDEIRTLSVVSSSETKLATQSASSKKQPPSAPAKQDPMTLSSELVPPLPQRRYEDEPEVSEAAPPIPVRMYSPPPLAAGDGIHLVRSNSEAVGNRVPGRKPPRGEESHYATVVVKAPEEDPDAPPLPERTAESEELLPTGLPEQQALPDDTIAYAIVCCNGEQDEQPAKKRTSMENSAPVAPPPIPSNPSVDDDTTNKKWRTVYEEIDFLDAGVGKKTAPPTGGPGASPQEGGGLTADGKYMVVDRNKAATLRIVQQPATFPLATWKPTNLSQTAAQTHTLPGAPKKAGGSLPSPVAAVASDQPPGSLQGEYDLPLNSRRLLSQPPAGSAASPLGGGDDPSYSKLVADKDPMLALRSGVKLRHSSISGSELLLTPRPDEGEGFVGGASDDHSSNEDIIEKCIRSLQEEATPSISQQERATPTSNPPEATTSVGYHLQKIPDTPPRWVHTKRKPHHYEDVDRDRDVGSGDQMSLCTVSSRSLPDLDYPELDWDESDLGTLTPSSSPLTSGATGSASQPNLLDHKLFAKGTQGGAASSPGGGGGGGGGGGSGLQQRRRKNHRYEDVDLPGDALDNTGGLKRKVHASLHGTRSSQPEERMPKGWQIMTDENGVRYYWHVPSGKTQYNKPTGEQIRRNSTSQLFSDLGAASSATPKCQKFTARYINSLPVQESDLVPGECVKVVHACISKLQPNRESSAAIDKGKVVTIQIEDMQMKWLSPESTTPLCVQAIGKIRVWGIGLENERDFGYVARDPVTRQHRCYVFRCDSPARALGRALLEGHQLEKKGGGGGSTMAMAMEDSPTREPARLPESREGALSERGVVPIPARGHNESSIVDVLSLRWLRQAKGGA